jgi:hypothetical protein
MQGKEHFNQNNEVYVRRKKLLTKTIVVVYVRGEKLLTKTIVVNAKRKRLQPKQCILCENRNLLTKLRDESLCIKKIFFKPFNKTYVQYKIKVSHIFTAVLRE